MTARQRTMLRTFEGRFVHVSLADGSRIDDVSLVSAGSRTLWVFFNGQDAFIPMRDVIDVWETAPLRSAA